MKKLFVKAGLAGLLLLSRAPVPGDFTVNAHCTTPLAQTVALERRTQC